MLRALVLLGKINQKQSIEFIHLYLQKHLYLKLIHIEWKCQLRLINLNGRGEDFTIIISIDHYLRLDKDQFNEDEKNDALEEQKRRAEENREVPIPSFIYLLTVFFSQGTAEDGAKPDGEGEE